MLNPMCLDCVSLNKIATVQPVKRGQVVYTNKKTEAKRA